MQVRRAHTAQHTAGVRGGHGGSSRHLRDRSCRRDERSGAQDGRGGGCDEGGGRGGVDVRLGRHTASHVHLPLELSELSLRPPQRVPRRRRRRARGPLPGGGGTHLSLQLVQLVRVRELGLGLREVEG